MNFFGLGVWEILFIVLIVLVVVGPERLPQLARQLGLLIARVQSWLQRSPDARMIMQARQELEREIANLRAEMLRMQQAQQQLVASAQQAINEPLATLKSVEEDLKNAGKSLEDSVKEASTAASSQPAEAQEPTPAGDGEPALPAEPASVPSTSGDAVDLPAEAKLATPTSLEAEPALAATPEPPVGGANSEITPLPETHAPEPPVGGANSEVTPLPETRAVARTSGTAPSANAKDSAQISEAAQPGFERPDDLPLDSLYLERKATPEPPQLYPQAPDPHGPDSVVLEPQPAAETMPEAIDRQADALADLTAEAEATTVATQFEELMLRMQALAADLALFQHELQRRGLLGADRDTPPTDQPPRNGVGISEVPPYAEPVTSSASNDSRV